MAKFSSEDREFQQQFDKSLKVSSYMDEMIDKIYNNQDIPEGMVPNLGDGSTQIGNNESGSLFHLDDEMIWKTAANSLGHQGISAVIGSAVQPSLKQSSPAPHSTHNLAENKRQFKISKHQFTALTKYPALIEFLGTDGGASLVKEIAAKVNEFMVKKIETNSKEISKHAQVCVTDRQNIKQYFAGDNKEWVCAVTASGPFRGDEAIFYHPEKDQAFVLRKIDNDYTDVTTGFNVIHEFANVDGGSNE